MADAIWGVMLEPACSFLRLLRVGEAKQYVVPVLDVCVLEIQLFFPPVDI